MCVCMKCEKKNCCGVDCSNLILCVSPLSSIIYSEYHMSKSKAGPPQQQERSVSLAFKEITEITPEILQRIGSPVELDLSNNNITYPFALIME